VLPAPSSPWPPPHLATPHRDIDMWSAWWSGNPDELSRVSGGGHPATEQGFTARGGLAGSIRRLFWGEPTPAGQRNTKLHIPLAAEVAQVSADLLFGQPPAITYPDGDAATATQERADALMGETVHTLLHEAAEGNAALGHVYLRVGWDKDVDRTGPILSVVDADAAYPTYRWGRLVDVTFCTEHKQDNGVMRHLQHHEVGVVHHGLYVGTHNNLGRMVPLSEHPSTTGLEPTVDGTGIPTDLTRLDVVAVPNQRSVAWRSIPGARELGRADIAGVEGVLDALDDVWSSWMRDVRHGRSRIHVPQHMLESHGPGRGASVDLDRELYVGLQAPPDGALQLTATQFEIRWQQHQQTALALTERIVSGAGYSPQTFGLQADAALTATESWARQVRTQNTRAAKIRRWRTALIQLTRLMVDVDRAQFKGKGNPDLIPDVDFASSVSESMLARAQTAAQLRAAEAASTYTLVALTHTDWDDAQIREEVGRIQAERGALADPMALFDRLEPPADDEPVDDGTPRA
jgi:hypothetical protein